MCAAVMAGALPAAKVVPEGERPGDDLYRGGRFRRGTPIVIAYASDFRDADAVLQTGLALRERFSEEACLLHEPDVFTLCDPERQFTVGPRDGKKPEVSVPDAPGDCHLKVARVSAGERDGRRAVGASWTGRRRPRRRQRATTGCRGPTRRAGDETRREKTRRTRSKPTSSSEKKTPRHSDIRGPRFTSESTSELSALTL